MTDLPALAKAALQEIRWDAQGKAEDKNPQGQATQPFDVQFNPQSLKVSYANQKAGGDQPAGSPVQFVGKGSTKLSLELIFDTTVLELSGPGGDPRDVRALTEKVQALMKPAPGGGKDKKQFIPPGVRFLWGSFLFEGVMDSMDETLEFFSSQGVPLRATVSLNLSKQDLEFQRLPGRSEGAGTSPFEQAKAGDSLQQMAADAGIPDWKPLAAANGLENPRALAPGSLVSLAGANAGLGAAALGLDAGAGFSVSGGLSGGLSGGFGGGSGGGFSAGASATAGFSAGASVDASFGASFGADAGVSAGADFGAGAGFGAGADFGFDADAGFGAGASAAAGASAGTGAGASAGASADAFAGASATASASASAGADVR